MNDREAIDKIIEAARITGLAAFIGEAQLAGWGESHDSGAKVTMWLPDSGDLEPFRGMTTKKGKQAGQRLLVIAFEIGADEQPVKLGDLRGIANVPDAVVAEKPFGKYAAELHRLGWFFNPHVLSCIGSDDQYRAWIQRQECVVCESADWVEEKGELRCEAAHVNRPSNAGTGHKSEFSCVSLCHNDHINFQHAQGLPTLYKRFLALRGRKQKTVVIVESDVDGFNIEAREWFDKERDTLLKEWASKTLATRLGYNSMGMVPPDDLANWAMERNLLDTLPAMYRG